MWPSARKCADATAATVAQGQDKDLREVIFCAQVCRRIFGVRRSMRLSSKSVGRTVGAGMRVAHIGHLADLKSASAKWPMQASTTLTAVLCAIKPTPTCPLSPLSLAGKAPRVAYVYVAYAQT